MGLDSDVVAFTVELCTPHCLDVLGLPHLLMKNTGVELPMKVFRRFAAKAGGGGAIAFLRLDVEYRGMRCPIN